MQAILKVTSDEAEEQWRPMIDTFVCALQMVGKVSSKVKDALQGLVGEVESTKRASIIFTLRFSSWNDLKRFKSNLDSGLLDHLFKDALITEDPKNKLHAYKLKVSITIVDQWEYEMCQKELAHLKGKIHDNLEIVKSTVQHQNE